MTSSHALRRRILGGTVVALVGATMLTVASPASGAPDRKEFSATVSPSSAVGGQRVAFAVTVTNSARSNSDLGSVQLVVPNGFTGITLNTAPTTPSGGGKPFFPSSCSSGSPSDCGAPGSTLVQVSTPASTGAQKIPAGGKLTFTVSAVAPLSGGTYPWNVAAKNSASWSDGQLFTLTSPKPSVAVTAPNPTQLAFTSQPSAVTAGELFNVSVALRTATGQATTSTARSSSRAMGRRCSARPRSTRSTAPPPSRASLSGSAGSFTLTATSGSLTQAVSSSISVSAGSAAQLALIQAPPTSIVAGQSVSASVAVQDPYGNQTSSTAPVTLTVSRTGGPTLSDTEAAVNGVANVATVRSRRQGPTRSASRVSAQTS